ncbi:PotD/PotF family extracellular solute-binding protein [Paraconexibacter sp.]|uniref:ABC transporter substrate-binding protein n=1 Tax=Paraconexibacter sp. TaxID=2949640 RepID=UPI003565DF6D
MPEQPRPEDIIERLLAEQRLSRRGFLRKAGATGLTFSGAAAFLAACGGVEGTATKTTAETVAVDHPKVPITQLNFSNWPLYIDKSVIKSFEKEYGGKVKYTEEINDNQEFFGKVRQQLQQGQAIGRDIVVLTDYMATRWIRNDYLTPIDKKNVPNAQNLVEGLRAPNFDPSRQYSLPWQSGMTAIGYNPKRTGGKLSSINDIFDPKFKGRVTMLADPHDSASLMILADGKKTADATIDDVLAAIDRIDEENRKGQIRRFTGNDYTTDLAKGNVWISVAYSGDVIQLQADNPELEFLIPDEGAVLWSDNMLMPQKAAHPYAAETMMNYVYEPEIAAKIAAYVNYVTPVIGAQEELAKTDPETAENELIFPSDETRAKLNPYPTLSPEDENRMLEAMQKVTGA